MAPAHPTPVVNQVSGPVSLYAFDIGSNGGSSGGGSSRIMVFGDMHFSNRNMCSPCVRADGCASVLDFIDERSAKAEARGTTLDVFLELPYVPPPAARTRRARAVNHAVVHLGAPPPSGVGVGIGMRRGDIIAMLRKVGVGPAAPSPRYVGLLGDMMRRYKDRLYPTSPLQNQQQQQQQQQRFHYADIRSDPNIHALLPVAPEAAATGTIDGLRQLMHAFLFSADFVADVIACCGQGARVVRDGLTTLAPPPSKQGVGTGTWVHRIAKQFHALPGGPVKDAVRAYLTMRVEEVLDIMRNDVGMGSRPAVAARYYDWLDHVRSARAQCYAFGYKTAMHLGVWVVMMDAYLLCRMLRFLGPGSETIVYVGDAHAEFYARFFVEYMGLRPLHDFASDSRRSRGGRERRCVTAGRAGTRRSASASASVAASASSGKGRTSTGKRAATVTVTAAGK